jgi:hypothetical protein
MRPARPLPLKYYCSAPATRLRPPENKRPIWSTMVLYYHLEAETPTIDISTKRCHEQPICDGRSMSAFPETTVSRRKPPRRFGRIANKTADPEASRLETVTCSIARDDASPSLSCQSSWVA